MPLAFQVGDSVHYQRWTGVVTAIETVEIEGEPGPQRLIVVVLDGGTQRIMVPERAASTVLRLRSARA